MEAALAAAQEQGGKVHGGGRVPRACRPAVTTCGRRSWRLPPDAPIVQQETFAPILYLMRYRDLDEAIRIHNNVPQGLSSAILTGDVREAEHSVGRRFGLRHRQRERRHQRRRDRGAFGGEKETGGGRETGSDAWKAYMRRVTSTVNYSDDLPPGEGIEFDV